MILIPTSTEADYTISAVLDNELYDFRFQYNVREEAWYCYLALSGLDPIIKFKLSTGHDLIRPYSALEGMPSGGLWLVDTVAYFGRVGRDDFQQFGRFSLVYVEEGELDTL